MQRSVGVRKQDRGIEGLLPMVESAAAVRRIRLSATERMEALSGSSWNQSTVRQTRKAKTKPISAGRSRKSLRSVAGVKSVCWSVVVMGRTGWRSGFLKASWPLALGCCESIAVGGTMERKRRDASIFLHGRDNCLTVGASGEVEGGQKRVYGEFI